MSVGALRMKVSSSVKEVSSSEPDISTICITSTGPARSCGRTMNQVAGRVDEVSLRPFLSRVTFLQIRKSTSSFFTLVTQLPRGSTSLETLEPSQPSHSWFRW